MAGPAELPDRSVQLRGSRIARTLLGFGGWHVEFRGLPSRQGVVVIYPHTSNWDFVVGVLAKWSIGIPVVFWGKASLFRVPLLGRWLRRLGGIPVQRDAPGGVVGQTVAAMRAARDAGRFMWLALAPEGTRGATRGWRSGFYHVACGAGLPIGLVGLDYRRRLVAVDSFWRASGDIAADFAHFAARLAPFGGLRPQLAAPVRPIEA
jgi:1-acyl-sn-glycerol-3-phosphate acyltransferase